MKEMIDEAIKHLKKDKIFSKIIKKFPKLEIKKSKKYFEALVRSIIFQQLSGKSASSIYKKFSNLVNGQITFEKILELSDSDFKSAGISPQKMSYLKDLAKKFKEGEINSKKIHKMKDDEIISHLVRVRGIGVWTSQMFLMFTLGRMDVLPLGDLGIQKGFMYAYGLKKIPKEKKMLEISKNWTPFRTIASMYLWKVADKEK